MKKMLTIMLCAIASITFGQNDSVCSGSCKNVYGYVSAGLSLTNTTPSNFKMLNYASIEGGIMVDNLGLGLVFGRGSLLGLGSSTDNIKNYFYEVKGSGYYPIGGSLTGVIVLGYGGYINTKRNFIEYGVGMSYSVNKFSYGVTYSNWDGGNYLTPNICLNF